MQNLLAAVAVVATFASAAGRPIELPTSASASLKGSCFSPRTRTSLNSRRMLGLV
jgi:hypothetical protein